MKHLRDENHVLREEIEHMTQEIDQMSNGRDGKHMISFFVFVCLGITLQLQFSVLFGENESTVAHV